MLETTQAILRTPTDETPLYAREFAGFQLDFALPEGFKDTSWHHNETPSFDKVQPDGTIFTLWVDYADRRSSTLPHDELYFRFSLARYTTDENFLGQLAFASTPREALDIVGMYDNA